MTKEVELPIELVSEEAQVPVYSTEEAAGADLFAQIEKEVVLQPGQSTLIPTGIKCETPKGYEIQIRPRSGLAYKHQITVLNTPATIDSDYRGEIKVILINHSKVDFAITPQMRIAQMVLAPALRANFKILEEVSNSTERGEGGFGHTGTH